jgi:(1->4)-alpha-D-glucan 1-alpha-D-glucosylmutase
LEDTAFYIFNRLAALNDVGGNPNQFGMSPERFHERNRARMNETPQTMLATTTHDSKRSGDVRARIAVLSEMPEEWQKWLDRWSKLNLSSKSDVDGESAPSANEEYLIYQTLVGTWPLSSDPVGEEYCERIQQYSLKAIKEAKVNSSWIQPQNDWEAGVSRFVAEILAPEHPFRLEFEKASATLSWYGMLNSLTQTILKLTVPGVPDLYQGTELWDFNLVDPDNRRPIDYEERKRILDEVQKGTATDFFGDWKSGNIKMYVITRLLNLRRTAPQLFQQGTYSSLYATGPNADSCVAFTRRHNSQSMLVIVPRLTTHLCKANGPVDWKETTLYIDETLPAMEDLFTGVRIKAGLDSFPLKNLNAFPYAVFVPQSTIS